MDWQRDGHTASFQWTPDGVDVSVNCPPDCSGACAPRAEFDALGGREMLEYTEWRDGVVPISGPVPFEWRSDGYDDDYEFWWRPLPETVSGFVA